VVGIAVGVALVFAALVANASLTGAVRELSEAIVGKADFQLSARSAAGFDQRVVAQVQRIPGATATPIVEARVNLVGPRGRSSVLLVGGDPRLERRRGLFLPPPLVDDLGVRRGERVTVETGAGRRSIALAGTLGRVGLGALSESPVAMAPLSQVRAVTGMRGRVSRVFVDAAPGRERAVEAALRRIAGNRLNVTPADQEVTLFEHASYPTSASTALFSVLSALVGFLFAFNAMLLTVPQRRRLIAELRMAGYAPAGIVQVVLADALLLGIAGSAAGLALGELASRLLFDSVPGYLTSAFAIGSQRLVTWQSLVLAAGAGVLAAFLATLIPIRGALSAAPRQEPTTTESPRWQRLAIGGGVACLVSSLLIGGFAPAFSLAGLAVLLVGLLLLLQVWLRLAATAFDVVCRRLRNPAAIMAALELRSASARTRALALAATGAVAVFAVASIGGARADLQRGLDGIAESVDDGAQVWVAFRGPANIFGTTAIGVAKGQMRAIEGLRGVRAVSRNRGSFLDVGHERVWVLAPTPSRVGGVLRRQVEDGDPALAERRLRRGGWVALSEDLASELDVGIGDRVDLPLPRPTRLRLAALTNNFGWPGGAIVMNARSYARAWGSHAFSTLGVRLGPGAEPVRIANAVQSILGQWSPLRAEAAGDRLHHQRAASRAGLSRLDQIAAMVLICSVLAMAASMAGLVWQRRPTFAAMKVHGIGQGQLWFALLLEGALLLGAGCLLGAAFGLVGQHLLDRALETITGFPVSYELAGTGAAGAGAGVTAAALFVLAIPGWLAVRVPGSTTLPST